MPVETRKGCGMGYPLPLAGAQGARRGAGVLTQSGRKAGQNMDAKTDIAPLSVLRFKF